MSKNFTVTEFFKRFPDDDSCLEHLMLIRHGETMDCPKCCKHGKFSRIKKIPAYQCSCGFHVHPMVGTPFEKSRTPLQKWFYAMYLFTTSRHGVPAKELQRQLGVTYKCAWRIGHEIRKYMGSTDGDNQLKGHIEVDETYVGGRTTLKGKMTRANVVDNKTVIFGMVERGGEIITRVIPKATKISLLPPIMRYVKAGSTISSDELPAYKVTARLGYTHGYVTHGSKQWKKGIHHTNTIEAFWSHLKRSILGTHIHVSKKHMEKYLGEFECRYNMRDMPEIMFNRLLLSF